MKSIFPDPRWQWFWRVHLLVCVGVLLVSIALDVGMVSLLFSGSGFFPKTDPIQVETFRNDMTHWLTWTIPGDLALIPLTAAQYGFCAQQGYFGKHVAVTTFWVALVFVLSPLVLMAPFPGSQIVLAVRLFLAFELFIMWLYVYRSPHLWKLETSATL
jgi:hypothetical protein